MQPPDQKIWDVVRVKNGNLIMRKRKLENYPMSEDCLFLNIYTPRVGTGTPLLTNTKATAAHGQSYSTYLCDCVFYQHLATLFHALKVLQYFMQHFFSL